MDFKKRLLKVPGLNKLLFGKIGLKTLVEGLSENFYNYSNFPEMRGKFIDQLKYKGYGDAIVSNCDFIANSARSEGGALRVIGGSAKVYISNCKFNNNYTTAGNGGALQLYNAESATIENSEFYNNKSGNDGGGFSSHQTTMSVLASNCYFTGNSAGDDAGAVYLLGTVSVVNCSFDMNRSTDNGGAIGSLNNATIGKIINCNIARQDH